MLASGGEKGEGNIFVSLGLDGFFLSFWSFCSCKSGRAGELFESVGMLEDTCNMLKIQAPGAMKAI